MPVTPLLSCTLITHSLRQVLCARELQAEFWAELALKSPSIIRLDAIGLSAEKAMTQADAGFKRLLQLNPNAVPVIRRYAQFLEEVTNDSSGAEALNQQADDLEEVMAKEFAARSSQVGWGREGGGAPFADTHGVPRVCGARQG
jgi:hypothetical protein